jgi:tRNA 2-thiocytidine biosynthesis protein TtcA
VIRVVRENIARLYLVFTLHPPLPLFRPLIGYMSSLGVPYHFLSLGIMDLAKEKLGRPSICAFCARMKRGLLYACCKRENYTVLALGQHADDLAGD